MINVSRWYDYRFWFGSCCRAVTGHGRMGRMGWSPALAPQSHRRGDRVYRQGMPRGPAVQPGQPPWSATLRTNSRQMKRRELNQPAVNRDADVNPGLWAGFEDEVDGRFGGPPPPTPLVATPPPAGRQGVAYAWAISAWAVCQACNTSADSRPRSLTLCPLFLAHARIDFSVSRL
jgi:hypothetical protein